MELNKALEWAKGIEAHTDGTAYEVDVKNVTSKTDISDVDPQDIRDARDTETEPNTDGGDEVKASTDHDLVSAEEFSEADLASMKKRLVEVGCESDYMVDVLLDNKDQAAKVLKLYGTLFDKAMANDAVRREFEPLCMYYYGQHQRDTTKLLNETITKLEELIKKFGGVSVEDFEVTTNPSEGAAKTIDATHVDPVTDSPKRYVISGFNASNNPAFEPGDKANELVIILQNGTLPEKGVNGVTAEDLLKVCEEVFICYQESKFACEENQEALNHIQGALGAMAKRRNRRTEQGTEGTHEGN